MAASTFTSPLEVVWRYAHRGIAGSVLLFLIAPILVVLPLSLSSGTFFNYPIPGISGRWYMEFFFTSRWQTALRNSIVLATATTVLSTPLGTLAALGLSRANFPWRTAVMGLVISPMIVPSVITAVGIYFFYSEVGLLNSFSGLVLAHTMLATPYVVVAVTATLSGFDHSLTRAAAGLGASPIVVFFRVVLPLILPGMATGALFAFLSSFDELVTVLFVAGPEQRTLPKVMFSGLREEINPTLLAASVVLISCSTAMLAAVALLRRRSERLRGLRSD